MAAAWRTWASRCLVGATRPVCSISSIAAPPPPPPRCCPRLSAIYSRHLRLRHPRRDRASLLRLCVTGRLAWEPAGLAAGAGVSEGGAGRYKPPCLPSIVTAACRPHLRCCRHVSVGAPIPSIPVNHIARDHRLASRSASRGSPNRLPPPAAQPVAAHPARGYAAGYDRLDGGSLALSSSAPTLTNAPGKRFAGVATSGFVSRSKASRPESVDPSF